MGQRSYTITPLSLQKSRPDFRRRAHIDVKIGSKVVRRYKLKNVAASNGVTELREITDCAVAADVETCKAPTVFEYQSSANSWLEAPVATGSTANVSKEFGLVFNYETNLGSEINYGPYLFPLLTVLDANGDGKDDLLTRGPNFTVQGGAGTYHQSTWKTLTSQGSGSTLGYVEKVMTGWQLPAPAPTDAQFSHAVCATQDSIVDFEGDGDDDIIDLCGPGGHAWGVPYFARRLLRNTGSSWSPEDTGAQGMAAGTLVDLTADGWVDVLDGYGELFACGTTWHTGFFWAGRSDGFVSTGSGNGPEQRPFLCPRGKGINEYRIDFDGDGFQELVRRYDDSPWRVAGWRQPSDIVSMPDMGTTTTNHPDLRQVDLNGDGLNDVLLRRASNGSSDKTPTAVQLWMNTGARGLKDFGVVDEPLNKKAFESILAFDYDGDGRQDILRLNNELTHWVLVRSLPDHQVAAPEVLSAVVPVLNRGQSPAVVADVDGDGDGDVVFVAPDGKVYAMRAHTARVNVLKTIVDGVGKRTEIKYADAENRTYVLDDIDPMPDPQTKALNRVTQPLVREYSVYYRKSSTQSEIQGTTKFRFENAVRDAAGRGWAFGTMKVEEYDAAGIKLKSTISKYHTAGFDTATQTFPLFGLKKNTVTEYATAPASWTKDGKSARVEKVDYEWQTRLSDAGRPFPYLERRTTVRSDAWNGKKVELRTEENLEFDEFGNETFSESIVYNSDGEELERRTTTTAYVPPNADQLSKWLVSLPESTIVESTRAGVTQTRFQSFEEYDDRGLLEKATRAKDGPEDLEQVVETPHDAYGNARAIKITAESRGITSTRQTTLVYDSRFHFLERVLNAKGQEIQVQFDPRTGEKTRLIDPNGLEETWQYDGFGQLVAHRAPDGSGEDVTYALARDVTGSTIPVYPVLRTIAAKLGGGTTITETDSFGRVVRTINHGFGQTEVIEEHDFDAAGRPFRSSRPHVAGDATQGVVTRYYDSQGRPKKVVQADGTTLEHEYASPATLSTIKNAEYLINTLFFTLPDDAIDVVAVKDAKGNVDVQFLDHHGKVRIAIDARKTRTWYAYSSFGDLAEIIDSDRNVTTISYDDYGRRVADSDPDHGAHTYIYNGLDEKIQQVDPGTTVGTTSTQDFYYDELGRLERLVNADGTTEWVYDGDGTRPNEIGRLVEERVLPGGVYTNGNSIKYEYEPNQAINRGRLTAQVYNIRGSTLRVAYDYDSVGRVQRIHYPAALTESFSVEHEYDPRTGKLSAVKDPATNNYYWRLTGAYQGYMNQTEVLGNSLTTTRDYYPTTGLPKSIATKKGVGTTRQHNTYTFDSNGNLTERRDVASAAYQAFVYDSLNRLTAIRSGTSTKNISYDDIGNILNQEGKNYSYQGSQPHAVTHVAILPIGAPQYKYDARGNQIQRPAVTSGTLTIDYTMFNLPYRMTQGALLTQFEYSAGGDRIVKAGTTGVRLYVGQLYERFTPKTPTSQTGDVQHFYRVFAAGRQVAQVLRKQISGNIAKANTDTVYLHDNHLGSTHVITDYKGDQLHRQTFDPFGTVEDLGGTTGVLTGFTGHQHDPELGLINMRGRLYDPKLGRFLSPDPKTQKPFWSQGLNRYSYVFNNPLTFRDPTGYQAAGLGAGGPATAGPVSSVSDSTPTASNMSVAVTATMASYQRADPGVPHFVSSGGCTASADGTASTCFSPSGESITMEILPEIPAAPAADVRTQPRPQNRFTLSELFTGNVTFAKYAIYGDYWGSSFLQDNAALDNAMKVSLGISVTALTMGYGELALGAVAVRLGAGAALGTGVAARGAGGLAHLTNNAAGASIAHSGKLVVRGGIYASSLGTASRTGLAYTARTGLSPSAATVGFRIPQGALGAFRQPVPIGPMTAWQRWGGTYYSAGGSIDLAAGTFTRTGVNWNQVGFYAFDVGVDATVVGAATYYGGEDAH